MAKHKSRHADHRQPLSGTGSCYSDEFVFGISRGACARAQRNSGRGGRALFEAKKTFEETYPRYPFAELVRLSIGLGNWLARAGEALRQSFARSFRKTLRRRWRRWRA